MRSGSMLREIDKVPFLSQIYNTGRLLLAKITEKRQEDPPLISLKKLTEIKHWMHRNARELELNLWKYWFENGSREAVVTALTWYQNEDGGFGNALDADNWNPGSSPYQTSLAIRILGNIGFTDVEHPVYQGIFKYLYSETDLTDYGWRFCIPTNDRFPHAPWWQYNEERNLVESLGPTCVIAGFILKYMDPASVLYEKTINLVNQLLDSFRTCENFGDMGIAGVMELIGTLKDLQFGDYDYEALWKKTEGLVKKSIETDVSQWAFYGVRPSNYISGPQSPCYEENKEIVEKELDYLEQTLPENGVWGITWTWFENNEKYAKEFAVSENWWKASAAIDKLLLLRNFGRLEAGWNEECISG